MCDERSCRFQMECGARWMPECQHIIQMGRAVGLSGYLSVAQRSRVLDIFLFRRWNVFNLMHIRCTSLIFPLHRPMTRAAASIRSRLQIYLNYANFVYSMHVPEGECRPNVTPRKWDSSGGYAFNLMVLDINRRKRWQVTPIKHTMASSALSAFHVAPAQEMNFSLGLTATKNDKKSVN